MTRKTFTYSQSIADLLFERYNIAPLGAQNYPPHQVFALIVQAHLGKRWTREIESWIEAVGGRIVWDTTEEEDEDLDPTVNHYDYTEDLDDEAEGSWEEVLDQETGAVWRVWTVNDD